MTVEILGSLLLGIGMLLIYLSPLVLIVLAIRAWQKLESHHRRMEAELLLLNQQIGRLLEGGTTPGERGHEREALPG